MTESRSGLFFDAQDYELVELIDEFVTVGKDRKPEALKQLFDPFLHPRGIKELAASSERRIAYAVIRLLDSLEAGRAEDRLGALRCVSEEVLHTTSGPMRRNTARVLLEIMKQLVRERGSQRRKLELAHDFFTATAGRPTDIRRQLERHHLVEMPEEWNQVAFDHHVHDANTKGRKAPTHLIMDAWIKGIRELTVVYYNYIRPEAAAELLEAAAIMGIAVRVGVEVSARFRGKYVNFIWAPRGFKSTGHVLTFLEEEPVKALFGQGMEVAAFQRKHVLDVLDAFNRTHLAHVRAAYGIDAEALDAEGFLAFVGVGQASLAHLADYIHQELVPHLRRRAEALLDESTRATGARREEIAEQVEALDALTPSEIAERYLRAEANPGLEDPKVPRKGRDVPALLRLSPKRLVQRLVDIRAGFRLTLNPSNLTAADVVELLWECEGAITHLEIFNLKDYRRRSNPHTAAIARIRRIVNAGNPIGCKRMLREVIAQVEADPCPEREHRLAALHRILANIPRFLSFYANSPLASRIGSDSIGRAKALFGMGLLVAHTVPPRAQRRITNATREVIPVRTEAILHTAWLPKASPLPWLDAAYRAVRHVPGLRTLGYDLQRTYVVPPNVTRTAEKGNIVTLGGIDEHPGNGLVAEAEPAHPFANPLRYLSAGWSNALKVLVGFIPAFLTMYLTKDWWVLAFFGAPIWFAITGVRNVIQSVVAAGGLGRSQLLKWRDVVSWNRVCDSLLYTGFSVPLLDWLVKTAILDHSFGVTTATSPVVLYSVMAVANGTYLATHNTIRGLPRAAVYGNFFRSVLSIPIAVALNAGLEMLLEAAGMSPAESAAMLQKWAAIIGKAASDTVAAFIEGTADRSANIAVREHDYDDKITQLLEIHGRLEVMYPEVAVLDMLASPKDLIQRVGGEAKELERRLIVNALDLLYFWMYQPRARMVFRKRLEAMQAEERQIVLRTQRLLERNRRISELFLDNLVGKNFSRALAFYLEKSPAYLRDLKRLEATLPPPEERRRAERAGIAPRNAPRIGTLSESTPAPQRVP